MSAPASRQSCVVVAEDDDEMRALVAQCLRRDGYAVLEVSDGARLLVHVASQYRTHDPADPIDLIVSDVRMPLVTGLAILGGLRAAHWTTPVILMTAFGDERVRQEAAELDAYLLEKPFAMGDLRAKVRELLTRPARSHHAEDPSR